MRTSKLFNVLGTLVLVGLSGVACYGSIKAHNKPFPVNHDTIPYERECEPPVMIELPPEPDYAKIQYDFYLPYFDWTEREKLLLVATATDEAGNQGVTGMALVMRVVLNRVEKNGTDIETEVFKQGQFATQGTTPGTWEAYEALDMVQMGWDESQGAIFFAAGGYNVCGSEKLFQYKDHYFSK